MSVKTVFRARERNLKDLKRQCLLGIILRHGPAGKVVTCQKRFMDVSGQIINYSL